MPGLFSQISSVFSGGDNKLVSRIEDFAGAYVIQGEFPRTVGLKREEVALLQEILVEAIYRAYCASRGRECAVTAISRLEEARKAREAEVGMAGESLERLETAFRHVADDLTNLARQRGKFESGFTSVDGLTESSIGDALGSHLLDVKAAKRAAMP